MAVFFAQFRRQLQSEMPPPATSLQQTVRPLSFAGRVAQVMPPPAAPARRLRSGHAWPVVAPTVLTPATPCGRCLPPPHAVPANYGTTAQFVVPSASLGEPWPPPRGAADLLRDAAKPIDVLSGTFGALEAAAFGGL